MPTDDNDAMIDSRIKALEADLRCVLGLTEGDRLLSVKPDGSAMITRGSGRVSRVRPSSVRESRMEDLILKLETALEFYADPANYHRKPPDGDSEVGDDHGKIARQALGRREGDD